MSNFGIFAGATPVDVEKLEKVQGSEWVGVHDGVLPMGGVFVGSEHVWPTYREEFRWYEWSTPQSDNHDTRRRWGDIPVPEWASVVDIVLCPSGGRGEDGTRGFGTNDGRGGFAANHLSTSMPLLGDTMEVHLQREMTFSTSSTPPGPTFFYVISHGVPQDVEVTVGKRSGSGTTGASMPVHSAFGRSWPGGAGGARDQPGQGYGAAGGGGEGGPVVGNPAPKQGQHGATGYAALRLRSGPVPDGHSWPENPDWANPQ